MTSQQSARIFAIIVNKVATLTGEPFGPIPVEYGEAFMDHLANPRYGNGVRVLLRLAAAVRAPDMITIAVGELLQLDDQRRLFAADVVRAMLQGPKMAEAFLEVHGAEVGHGPAA